VQARPTGGSYVDAAFEDLARRALEAQERAASLTVSVFADDLEWAKDPEIQHPGFGR
jgi:hypothetical protein